jgi:uncharacterized protein
MLLTSFHTAENSDHSTVIGRFVRGRFGFQNLVMQPTTACNLNCEYCYLPNRRQRRHMDVRVAERLADAIRVLPQQVAITWHGGEPLATGITHLTHLLQPFEELRKAGQVCHIIQTNGTLLNEDWISFLTTFGVHIGVSIDGPPALNARRVTWSGRDTFENTMRGIKWLRDSQIPFVALAVVGDESLRHAKEIYDFFAHLGCYSVGINIQEQINASQHGCYVEEDAVRRFWADLYQEWLRDPAVRVREFTHAFSWMSSVLDGADGILADAPIDLFPTVDIAGNVRLLAPEFLDATSEPNNDFIIGNVLSTPLAHLLDTAHTVPYVCDFVTGRLRCQQKCPHYSSCGGGNASHKFFAHGTTDATETQACRYADQLLNETLLSLI